MRLGRIAFILFILWLVYNFPEWSAHIINHFGHSAGVVGSHLGH